MEMKLYSRQLNISKKKLFLLIILLFINVASYAQIDTAKITKFAQEQELYETQFIDAIKSNDIPKALSFVSEMTITNLGKSEVEKQFKKMASYYKKYPNPKLTGTIGLSTDGVGSFGHDMDGSIELSSNYRFADKSLKDSYWITLYYTNSSPVGIIKHISFDDRKDASLLKIAD